MGIFVVFVTGLWLNKRKAYNGPKFDIILGRDLPVTVAEAENDAEAGSVTGKSAGSIAKRESSGA